MVSLRRLVIVTGAALVLASSHAFCTEIAEGRGLYMRYCASCHGEKADGWGSVARALKEQPADLRRLAEKYGTPLPAAQLARFIDGRDYVAAHGKSEMPVWGERFAEAWSAKGSHEGEMDQRIRKIITFLNSIQSPAQPSEPSHAPVSSLR